MAKLADEQYLVISCAKHIPYGRLVTILNQPRRRKDTWATTVLVGSSEHADVMLSRSEPPGERFVILGSASNPQGGFSHTATSVSSVERISNQVEDEIVEILHK